MKFSHTVCLTSDSIVIARINQSVEARRILRDKDCEFASQLWEEGGFFGQNRTTVVKN